MKNCLWYELNPRAPPSFLKFYSVFLRYLNQTAFILFTLNPCFKLSIKEKIKKCSLQQQIYHSQFFVIFETMSPWFQTNANKSRLFISSRLVWILPAELWLAGFISRSQQAIVSFMSWLKTLSLADFLQFAANLVKGVYALLSGWKEAEAVHIADKKLASSPADDPLQDIKIQHCFCIAV